MTFKGKLILAQAPLALALVLVGGVSSTVSNRLGVQSGKIFVENYRSVRAAQQMKESLERIDGLALFLLAGHGAESVVKITRHRNDFERELQVEERNITEAGEAEAAASLRASWMRYQQALEQFLAAGAPGVRDRLYFEALSPAFEQTKRGADGILDLNQDAIVRKSERAQQSAHRFKQEVTIAVLAALLGGLLLSVSLTTRLLRPLGVVSAAVRRFGQGDVAARARLEGSDEVAQLAAEFNTMADHLERYRASSLGELLQAQQATQAAMDGLPDPVVMLDASGRVRGINAATSRLLGVDPDLRPKDPLADVDPAVRSSLDRLRAHVAGGRGAYLPKGFEEALRVTSRDGEHIFLPRAAPIYDDAGGVAGVAIVLQDVTRLFRFDEMKSDLVAIVAHEFRTPLTSLRMAIHLCTEEAVGPLTAKQADLLFAAREDCERLQAIVDDLLNLSRIESGNIDLHRRRVSAEMLVTLANDVHRLAAGARQITLRSEVMPGCPEAFADVDRLGLVFSNLLSNAIRYSPPGGEIVVRTKPETSDPASESSAPTAGRWIRFEVSDQGPGISLEHQAELFQRFYRVPGSPEGGSGLGLFIARGIVQAHGGQIGVVSEPGKGATFWFTVPAAPDLPG
jgi:two-component system, NtrC family, sensor histidine kinase KinB